MLCALCDTIILDYDLLIDDGISILYERSDTYPGLPSISLAAKNGCELCHLLRDTINKKLGPIIGLDHHSSESIKIENTRFLTDQAVLSDFIAQLVMQLSAPSRGNTPLRFGISAEEGSHPAENARIRRRPIHPSSISPSCVRLMQRWIDECRETHAACPSGELEYLPTRIIDVGDAKGGHDPYLLVSDGAKGLYAALSHCWGPPSTTAPILKTKTGSIVDRFQGIPMNSMPQNFQDAVLVTRLLGLRYLWIDSLCIIQDDKSDWEIEGSKMDQVYKNAYVTLAATSAATSHDGFLQRNPAPENPITLAYYSRDRSLCHSMVYLAVNDGHINPFERSVDCAAWNDRGWTFQERYLSQRILHFCKDQAYFECDTVYKTESNDPVPFVPMGSMISPSDTEVTSSTVSVELLDESDLVGVDEGITEPAIENVANLEEGHTTDTIVRASNRLYERWYRLAAQYSNRKLTYGSDKLPAISGLAREMAQSTHDEYLAGIWKGDLSQGLLWIWRDNGDALRQPERYRGPSWSWVSLDGQITWQNREDPSNMLLWEPQSEPVLRFVEADIHTPNDNPYGWASKATLKVYAAIVPVSIHEGKVKSRFGHFPYDLEHNGVTIGAGNLDPRDTNLSSGNNWCLQVERQYQGDNTNEDTWSGLLLEGSRGTFRRIGVFYLLEGMLDFFKNHEARTLDLI